MSGVLPIMSLYLLPHGQYAYSGHVIKCLLVYDHCRFAKLAPQLRLAKARPTMPAFQLVVLYMWCYNIGTYIIIMCCYNNIILSLYVVLCKILRRVVGP